MTTTKYPPQPLVNSNHTFRTAVSARLIVLCPAEIIKTPSSVTEAVVSGRYTLVSVDTAAHQRDDGGPAWGNWHSAGTGTARVWALQAVCNP